MKPTFKPDPKPEPGVSLADLIQKLSDKADANHKEAMEAIAAIPMGANGPAGAPGKQGETGEQGKTGERGKGIFG